MKAWLCFWIRYIFSVTFLVERLALRIYNIFFGHLGFTPYPLSTRLRRFDQKGAYDTSLCVHLYMFTRSYMWYHTYWFVNCVDYQRSAMEFRQVCMWPAICICHLIWFFFAENHECFFGGMVSTSNLLANDLIEIKTTAPVVWTIEINKELQQWYVSTPLNLKKNISNLFSASKNRLVTQLFYVLTFARVDVCECGLGLSDWTYTWSIRFPWCRSSWKAAFVLFVCKMCITTSQRASFEAFLVIGQPVKMRPKIRK